MSAGEQPSSSFLSRIDQKMAGIAIGVFLAAMFLRLWGIGWGLPTADRWFSYHPDEDVNQLYARQIEPLQLQFSPGFYNYGTFYLTLTNFAQKFGAAYGGLGPAPQTPEELRPGQAPYQVRQNAVGIFAGRVMTALMGAGIAALVFLILYRRTHDLGAVFGAAMAAVAPAFVVHSRFATVDVPATFFLALSLYWACRLAPPPGEDDLADGVYMRFAAWSALCAGLSAACKYSGAAAIVALAVVVLIGRRRLALKTAGLSAAVCAAAFLVGVPGVFLDTAGFLRDISYEFGRNQHGIVFMATSSGFLFHLANLHETVGIIAVGMAVAGLARASYRGHAWAAGLLAFGLVYFILIGRADVKFLRYVFPLVPVVAVGFGWLVGQAHTHPKQAWKLVGGAGVISLGLAMSAVLRDGDWMISTDPRDSAAAWIKKEVGAEDALGVVTTPWFDMAPVWPQANAPAFVPLERRLEWQAASPVKVERYLPPNSDDRFDFDVRLLTETKPRFVYITSFQWDDYERVADSRLNDDLSNLFRKRFREFTENLRRDYEPAAVFGAGGPRIHDLMYIRPEITIWRKKGDSGRNSTSSGTTSSLSGG